MGAGQPETSLKVPRTRSHYQNHVPGRPRRVAEPLTVTEGLLGLGPRGSSRDGPLAPSRGYLLGPPHSEQRPPAPGFSAAQGRTPSRALPPRRPRTVPAAAPRSSSLHDVTPAHLLVTSAPTVARGGRLGEQKAANLRVSTLVTRLPRNSWFWKNRQTCGGRGAAQRRGAPTPLRSCSRGAGWAPRQ